MLNTAWDDDGENFNAPNWHGIAWGAECAWNASTTSPEDFNRRLGAVLFGEQGNHFGQAIQLLSAPGIGGLPNAEFWKIDFPPLKITSVAAERERWEKLLKPAREAIARLESCQKDATVNADVLDFFLFGARRMELCFQRHLDHLDAALAYREATQSAPTEAATRIAQAEVSLRRSRDAFKTLSHRFAVLWRRENKPYALDWTLARYLKAVGKYDAVLEKLSAARQAAAAGQALPVAKKVGLELIETSPAKPAAQ
jgi:hypothetical protein